MHKTKIIVNRIRYYIILQTAGASDRHSPIVLESLIKQTTTKEEKEILQLHASNI
jgi:hypothetical protein